MIDNKEVNRQLRTAAINRGLCNQWQRDWRHDWDLETMKEKFFKGIDFFILNRFISNDKFKELFSVDELRKNGVLVDDKYSLVNPEHAIMVGNSQSTLRFNQYQVSTLYIIDNSQAKIEAKNNSFVMVHLFDTAQVEIKQTDNAKVVVLLHSNSAVIISDDCISIQYELDYLQKKLG